MDGVFEYEFKGGYPTPQRVDPPPVRWRYRTELGDRTCDHAGGRREHGCHLDGDPNLAYGVHVEALFDALAGILTGPVWPTATEAVRNPAVENVALHPGIDPSAAQPSGRMPG